MDIDRYSFLVGFLAGFFVSGIGGWMLNRINVARNAMGAPDRPMNVATQGTPRGVMARASQAFQQCCLWSIALVVFAGVVAIFLFLWCYL